MKLELGVNSVCIDRRYSFDWLFDLMAESGIRNLQLASFFEMYFLEDEWFHSLAEKAKQRNIRIKSLFTSLRELNGYMTGDNSLERVARLNYLRLLHVANVLGADTAGSTMGACYRDKMHTKKEGIKRYIEFLNEMSHVAFEADIQALLIEPMSCLAEPPTLPEECNFVINEWKAYRQYNQDTVPIYFIGDITHGYADSNERVVHHPLKLFEMQIPHMCEFHFKNTDALFNSTFGFGGEEQSRGIIKLQEVKEILVRNMDRFPTDTITGYLEISGPRIGRDYSDRKLGSMLKESLAALKNEFGDFGGCA